METFSSRVFTIKKDINTVYDMVSNPDQLESLLKMVTSKFPIMEVTAQSDSISFKVKLVGKIGFRILETSAPNLVRFKGEGTPLPIEAVINLKEKDTTSTDVQLSVEANIPPFLAGMVKGRLTPVLEKISQAVEGFNLDVFSGK